jgi:5-methylcytosine-specific restriction endonuclease McrA
VTAGRRFTIPAPSAAEPGPALALAIFRRDGFACVYCGAYLVPLQLDHLRAKAHFPASAPASKVNARRNLVSACAACNQAKGPQNLSGFAAMLRGRGLPPKVVTASVTSARTAARRELHKTTDP